MCRYFIGIFHLYGRRNHGINDNIKSNDNCYNSNNNKLSSILTFCNVKQALFASNDGILSGRGI